MTKIGGLRYQELFFFSFLGCKTIKGGDPNALCIFPFRYRGKTYDTCITIGITNNQAWCATKVDNLGNYVRGKWGNCGQGCPFPEIEDGKQFSNFITADVDGYAKGASVEPNKISY